MERGRMERVYDRRSVLKSADDLWVVVRTGSHERALFFAALDNLLIECAFALRSGSSENFESLIAHFWSGYFAEVPFCAQISDCVFAYRRAARDWLWAVAKGMRAPRVRDVLGMQGFLTLRELIAAGTRDRRGIATATEQTPYADCVRVELDVALGGDEEYPADIAAALTSPITRLSSVLVEWLRAPRAAHREDPPPRETAVLPAAPPEGPPRADPVPVERNTARARGGSSSETALAYAQRCVMSMAIAARMRHESGDWRTEAAAHASALWTDVMGETAPDNPSEWVARFLSKEARTSKALYTMIRLPYRDVRDPSVRAMGRMAFVTCYVLAGSRPGEDDRRALLAMAKEYMTGGEQAEDLGDPLLRALKPYCAPDGRPDPAALAYLRARFDLIDSAYEWLRVSELDDVRAAAEEISSLHLDSVIALDRMREQIGQEALGRLIVRLAEPAYGNVLGRMYRFAQAMDGDVSEDPRVLLRSFFAILAQQIVYPKWEESQDLYPGWLVGGSPVVMPTRNTEEG